MAAMIFKLPPQFGQWSMSIAKTRLSSLAQLMRAGKHHPRLADRDRKINAVRLSVQCSKFKVPGLTLNPELGTRNSPRRTRS
jgi:hypothetical protein